MNYGSQLRTDKLEQRLICERMCFCGKWLYIFETLIFNQKRLASTVKNDGI